MEEWLAQELSKFNRATIPIDVSFHVLEDKNTRREDLESAVETIRKGRVVEEKSDRERTTIAFRLHFGKENLTYTVIAAPHETFIRVVTIWKEVGRV